MPKKGVHGARLRSAASMLMDALVDDVPPQDAGGSGKKDPVSFDGLREMSQNSFSFDGKGGADARSEAGSSAVSSHLGAPTWRRMLRPFANAMAVRLAEAEDSGLLGAGSSAASKTPVDKRLETVLTCSDGGGGGSVSDVERLLVNMLEELSLNDKDTGFVLLTAFYYLQPADLPFTALTWRPLLLVALHIAIHQTITNKSRVEVSRYKLLAHVKHWWSERQMAQAQEVFEARAEFIATPPRRSDLAKLYFQLRDCGLRMGTQESSVASVEALGELTSLFGDGSVHTAGEAPVGNVMGQQREALNEQLKSIFKDAFAMEAYEKMVQTGEDSSGLLEVSQSESCSMESSSLMSLGKDFGSKEKTVISL